VSSLFFEFFGKQVPYQWDIVCIHVEGVDPLFEACSPFFKFIASYEFEGKCCLHDWEGDPYGLLVLVVLLEEVFGFLGLVSKWCWCFRGWRASVFLLFWFFFRLFDF
jgi:hypothetical protein